MSAPARYTGVCQVPITDLPKVAIVVGDPTRALKLAELSTRISGMSFTCISKHREYHTYTGWHNGKQILFGSHGVGGGGASCYFEELIQCGVTTIIRAGTAGSFSPKIREGGMVVATGAVRCDGVTDRLVPPEYPAIANHEVLSALIAASKKRQDIPSWGLGLVTTMGHFYDGPLGDKNKLWAAAHVLAIEMEVSALLVIGGLRGIRTGAVLNIDNYVFERMETEAAYQPNKEVVHQGTARMLEVALDAAAALSK